MSFLLKARFNKDGCSTDSGITSITPSAKVNIFTEPSCLKNGDKCVTFPPYNYEAGLKKRTTIRIGENQPFTIYLKYKINPDLLDDEYYAPIISYGNEYEVGQKDLNLVSLEFKDPSTISADDNNQDTTSNGNSTYNFFLFIQEKEYFSILLNKQEGFSSRISYTFNNKWHTLCITRDSENILRFFIDGHISTENKSDGSAIELGNTIYIGKYKPNSRTSVILDGASLDDICILDTCVYTDNFVPPTMYFNGIDTKENYKYYNISNTDNITKVVQDAVEEKMFSTATHINNRQMGWLPRRLRIKWYQHTRQYFRNEEYYWTPPRPDATILNVYGLEIPYIYGYDRYRFMEGNAFRLWQENKILAFVLFINGKFVKLSDIDMVKSDWWLTFFIRGRDPRFNPKVESVDIIIIPFPVIYEEGLGEREDFKPLYSFNDQGLFDSSNGYTFYYIDKSKAPSDIDSIGTLDQYIPTIEEDNNNSEDLYNDGMFMHNIWRYGTLELVSTDYKELLLKSLIFRDVDGETIGNISTDTNNEDLPAASAIFRFNCTSDDKHIYPGDQIQLYMHTLHVSEDRYRIVGEDLLEFYDYKSDNIDEFVVTMQLVTDNREWELQDLTNVRIVQVTAEIDNQSVFTIPEVVDSDGYNYRYFLIFRGSVCILNTDRFVVSDDYTTLTFTNTEDFVPKGTNLYFVFVKILKADQFGPLHVKPIFLSTQVDAYYTNGPDETYTYRIKIPDLHGLEYNENNVMMFLQNTFVSPDRYVIEDNYVRLDTYTGDQFLDKKHVTFVLLKMVNRFEDPIDDHDRVVQEEVQRGRRYVLYELPIDKHKMITIDNFVTFDNNGYYISNLFGEVMNRNIIKELHTDDPLRVVPRYLTCVYSTDSLDNEANAIIPTNDDYVNAYITLREEYYELDDHFDEFMSDFDVAYSKTTHYGQNLARALDYMVCYNQNKLDRAYEKTTLIHRFTYDTQHFIDMLEEIDNAEDEQKKHYLKRNILTYYQFYRNGIEELEDNGTTDESNLKYFMELDREVYQDMYYDSFPIYFVNGLVPNWYQYTIYANNRMTIRMKEKPLETDSIELFLFRKIHNYLYPLNNTIRYNSPVRLDVDIDGMVNIDKIPYEKDILTNCSFEYLRGDYENNTPGEGVIDGILTIDKIIPDIDDDNYIIDGTVQLEYNEWTDNTEPGYGTIDGNVNIIAFEWNDDRLGYGTIDGSLYLKIPYNYVKENVIDGYEFITNTYVDNTSISLPNNLETTVTTDVFVKSEYENDEPDLGRYQYDYTFNTDVELTLNTFNDFYNEDGQYWNGYSVEFTNPSGVATLISDFDFSINNNNNTNTITVPAEFIVSFYTNEETYTVPSGDYEYTMTLNMTNDHGTNKQATMKVIVHIQDVEAPFEEDILDISFVVPQPYDLNLVSLEFNNL